MIVVPSQVERYGPGVDLSNLPGGVSVKMSDPVKDFVYTRNAVTLTYDVAALGNLRLSFAAMEFGDEPHEPPPSPFGDDALFDGVAISTDGLAWYEIQDLRNLRSDRFTIYDVDLDAAMSQWGLPHASALRVRFSQVDNNPAPMDGIFIHGIELTADLRTPVFHLPMNDNSPSPTVHNIAVGGQDQVFVDPAGDPNTSSHSVPGPNGTTALAFDGVDDRIDFGSTLLSDVVAAGRDFTMAFWFKTAADPGATSKFFLRRAASDSEPYVKHAIKSDRFYWWVGWGTSYVYLYSPIGMLDDQWHHVICRRQGQTLSLWVDGVARDTRTDPDYARSFFGGPWDPRAVGQVYQAGSSDWPFAMADLRLYDRAITDSEVIALWGGE